MVLGDIRNSRLLTALQGAQVSNDRPAIRDNDIRPVSHHCVFSVGDRVENLAVGHLADSVILERYHSRETVLFDDSVALSRRAMTHRTSDVETLLAALHQLARDFEGNTCPPAIAHFASVVIIGAGTEAGMWMRPGTDCCLGRVGYLRFRHLVTNRNRAAN